MQNLNPSDVRFDKRRKVLVNDGRSLKGLTALLKQTFYPRYVYTRPKHLPDLTVEKQCKRIKGSRRVGTGFDSKITDTVRLQQRYKLDPRCFWSLNCDKMLPARVTAADRKRIAAVAKRRNPYVQRFWRLMRVYEWTPISTQVPVRHDTLRIGTMVDVLCKDKHNNYKLLELKTGFESYYDTSSGRKLSSPFDHKSDCPRNQHQLQLAATEHMYRMTHKDHRMSQSIILRFHSSGVEIVPLDEWCTGRLMFERLRSQINKTSAV